MFKSARGGSAGGESLQDLDEIRAAAGWFASNKSWIQEQQVALCRVPAPTFLEQRRADFLMGLLAAMGYHATQDAVGNVVALRNPTGDQPLIVVSAHMDTVLAPRRPEEITVDADGTLYGPGVADNGAGLAALLALAKVFSTVNLRRDWPYSLAFLANVGEEGEGNLTGMRYLCQNSSLASKVAGILVLDGPGHEHITMRALASRRYEVSITGKGGHSWSDFGLANPNHALARAIARFADAHPPDRSTPDNRFSINCGILQGGSTINSIPQSAIAKVDIRAEQEELIEEITASLVRCVEQGLGEEHDIARRGKLSARVKEIGSRPGGALAEDSPLLAAVQRVDQELGIRSQLDTSSTDANIPLSMGIPAVTLGAGGAGGGAHTTEEWYRAEGRDLGLRRVFLVACAMLAGIAVPAPRA